jgi:hypothetical protein
MDRCFEHYNEKVAYVGKLIQLLYDDLEQSAGGLLHIVLDDGNVEDEHIKWCIDYCNREENANRVDKYLCLEIAHKMLELDMNQRRLIYYGTRIECDGDCSHCKVENEVDE